MFFTLPAFVVLSCTCAGPAQAAAAPVKHQAQKTDQPAPASDAITCPITGEQIQSCCCPVKK